MAPTSSPGVPDDVAARLAALRELAAADPQDAAAQFLLGRELLLARLPGQAARAFEAALRARPDYTAAYRQLGGALEADGRYAEAARAWHEGLDVAKRTRDLQSGREMEALLRRLKRDHGQAEPESP